MALGTEEVNKFTTALREGRIDDFYDEADHLRTELWDQKDMVKDRRYHLKTYKKCFKGDEFVSALLRMRLCSSRVEAAAVGCSFLMHGIVHHVVDDHNFKDEPMFYRFRRDDGTYKGDSRPYRTAAVMAVRLHGTIRSRHPELIADRDYGLSTFKRCFVGMHLVDHLMRERGMSWEQAEAIGKKLGQAGFIRHVCDDHEFEGKWLFYRFTFDKLKTDAGFLEFTKLKQGLEYLGHLEQPLQRQPSPSPRRRTESGGGDLPPVPSPARDRLGSASSSLSMMPPLPPPRSSSNASRLGTPPRLAGSSYPAARGGGGGPPEPAPGEHCAAVLAAPWYYGEIGREDTQQVFQRAGRSDDGAWLFRDFRGATGWYVLSVLHGSEIFHIIVHQRKGKWQIDSGPEFADCTALVAHYSCIPGVELPCALGEPVAKA